MEFLQEIEDRGYPVDYLLARIHGRRVFLLSDWDRILLGPDITERLMSTHYEEFISDYSVEGIWKRYQKELHWAYYQMNCRLRDIFKPFFLYSELNTILICLRYKSGKGNETEIEHLLSYSLLSEKIKDALRVEDEISSILKIFESRFGLVLKKSPDLRGIFLKDGLKGTEQGLTRVMFKYIFSPDIHPIINRFFISIANTKNIVTLFKHVKWGITASPALIEGGNIKESSLYKVMKSQEVSAIVELIYKQTGYYIEEPTVSRVELALNNYLTGQAKIMERESSDIGFILNYLWRCYIEAKNLSVMIYGKKIDNTMIKEELIYYPPLSPLNKGGD